jgi:bifunctional non-homologous end joining protein LigD
VKKSTGAHEQLILHGVTITHPDRVLFEEGTITKGDVARYYAAVAPFLLQDIQSRPISLLRCPSGITAEDDVTYLSHFCRCALDLIAGWR